MFSVVSVIVYYGGVVWGIFFGRYGIMWWMRVDEVDWGVFVCIRLGVFVVLMVDL